MRDTNRRSLLKGGVALGLRRHKHSRFRQGLGAAKSVEARARRPALPMLRWKYFVQSEDDAFVALINAFTQRRASRSTSIEKSYEDVQPKASVAANTGAGPDLFWGLYSLPHLFPQKCIDMTDVATYLGQKYGGWVDSAQKYGKSGEKWIAVPICLGRTDQLPACCLKKAGFSEFPDTTDALLEYAKSMKAQGTPGGMALGHASGDGNTWIHWCLWSFNGNVVDPNDKVILNSPETEKALLYAKQLYEQMIPGSLSGTTPSTTRRSWQTKSIGPTTASRSTSPPATTRRRRRSPTTWITPTLLMGPINKPTELHLMYPILAMNYTKYPQACKAPIDYMLEADQFNKWISAARGYLTHCLNAYDANLVRTEDPKRTPYRDVAKRSLTAGGLGSVGEKAATAIADFVVVDMFANVCTGREDPKSAMKMAERQMQRIYRS